MHETTKALLELLRTAEYVAGPTFSAWRDAGYPDLDGAEALPEGTCWVCKKDSEWGCHDFDENPAVEQWVHAHTVAGEPPARPYNGPPCPGFQPKDNR